MGVAAVLFVTAFGLLLASFPARNSDLWKHLSRGREATAFAAASPNWLYDLLSYWVFLVAGGAGLVAVKAVIVGGLAVLLLRVSLTNGNRWFVPAVCTVLAVLAMGNRLLLSPATVSYLLLGLTVWLLRRENAGGTLRAGVWPGWLLVILFVVWANLDRWVALGLGTVALTWLGRGFDAAPAARGRYLLRRVGAVAVLVAASTMSPTHVNGLRPPAELVRVLETRDDATDVGIHRVDSPFQRAYLSAFRDSPAALAYYPLLGLGFLSFVLVRPGWRWERFLPWLGLAVASGLQVRAVPFFAVVAGPVLAWNLQDYLARRSHVVLPRRTARFAARGVAVLGAAAILVCAWPGWLQGPPFEPRRWDVEWPTALERGAAALRQWREEGVFPPDTRTLHVSPETADTFAWFCPEDPRLLDDRLAADLAEAPNLDDWFRVERVTRVIVHGSDRRSQAVLTRLLADPDRWPLLHLKGGVVVFGWRDPDRAGRDDPFLGRAVDLDRLAFHPTEDEKAPASGSARASEGRWWDVFRRPVPPRSADRDEAAVLLLKAEALQQNAPVRHLAEWEASQAAGLVAAAAGTLLPTNAALRLTLLRPPVPDRGPGAAPLPPITRTVFALWQQYVLIRGDTPPGVLYASVRAARRAVAIDPKEAAAYLTLGKSYLRLLTTTCERGWAAHLPQLARLRQVQASAALNRAIAINPGLAEAHLELGFLYKQIGCLDLAVARLRSYRDATSRAGQKPAAAFDEELDRLTEALDRETRQLTAEVDRVPVADRAAMAARRGLAGKALALLLESDVAAFGAHGTKLEIELLLKTGQVHDVSLWMTPELEGSLGSLSFHWLRAQALAAAGEYAAADVELAELAGRPGKDQVAGAFGRLVGRAVLNEQAGLQYLPQLVWRALARNDFVAAAEGMIRGLTEESDAATLRGLVALEAGEIDRAREHFRQALAFSDERTVGSVRDFGGWPVARTCLNWIERTLGPG